MTNEMFEKLEKKLDAILENQKNLGGMIVQLGEHQDQITEKINTVTKNQIGTITNQETIVANQKQLADLITKNQKSQTDKKQTE